MPAHDYNFLGIERFTVAAQERLKPGKSTIRFEFAFDGGGLGNGIPLLEAVPGIGALFRPRRTTVSTIQENIILVDALVYPTALAPSEKCWLAVDSANSENAAAPMTRSPVATTGQDELAGWVLQTLRRQAQASLSETGNTMRLAQPSGEPPSVSPLRPLTR